jgi:hypothetical protein
VDDAIVGVLLEETSATVVGTVESCSDVDSTDVEVADVGNVESFVETVESSA